MMKEKENKFLLIPPESFRDIWECNNEKIVFCIYRNEISYPIVFPNRNLGTRNIEIKEKGR